MKTQSPSEAEILQHFSGSELDDHAKAYLRFHSKRYEFLFSALAGCISLLAKPTGEKLKILDIGPSFETELIAHAFSGAVLDTMGIPESRKMPGVRKHINFDLNDCQFPNRWPEADLYDVIVMAEVLEHLHTSPRLVFRFLAKMLKPRGCLILQTPNAVGLGRRLRMLRGINPQEAINDDARHSTHLREYTLDELIGIGREAGLMVEMSRAQDYFNTPSALSRMLGKIPCIPKSLRRGITIIYRKR